MKVCITTTNREVGDHIYDLLTNPISGTGFLSGSKICVDEHNMVPDIMEFDLNHYEIEAVKKLDGVLDVMQTGICKMSLQSFGIGYQKVKMPDATFRLANHTWCDNISTPQYTRISPSGAVPPLTLAPAHLYYSTNYDIDYTQNKPETLTGNTSALSINCQGVDILILDSGVDPTCEDLKDMYGNDLVQLFDWSQVLDGVNPYTNGIPNYVIEQAGYTGMASNYYVDYSGHGTSVASTIAGYKCGLAKNAKIYSLNAIELGALYGFDGITCLKLALGFAYGKANGWYGLNPRTPTIFCNSWSIDIGKVVGYSLYVHPAASGPLYGARGFGPIGIPSGLTKMISPIDNGRDVDGNNNDGLLSQSFGNGGVKPFAGYCTCVPYFSSQNLDEKVFLNSLPGTDPVIDGYFRSILDSGVHCVVSAGNSNLDLNQQNPTKIPFLQFTDTKDFSNQWITLHQMVLNNKNVYESNATGLTIAFGLTGVNTLNIVNAGTGYTSAPALSIDGGGVNNTNPANRATATCSVSKGQIVSFNISNKGSGYITNPKVTLTGGGGTGAKITAKIGRIGYSPQYTIGTDSFFFSSSGTTYLNYGSPDIGPGPTYSRDSYPLIKVGCVTPLGNVDLPNLTYDTGGYSRSIYSVLNGMSFLPSSKYNINNVSNKAPDGVLDAYVDTSVSPNKTGLLNGTLDALNPTMGILYNDGVNNTNLRYSWNATAPNQYKLTTIPFVKSPYSNFGPAVDIYAVGCANWSGFSNQTIDKITKQFLTITGGMSATTAPPFYIDNPTQQVMNMYGNIYNSKFIFFNGTSCAAPAVAGCLATFLAQYPNSTPLEAKNWLISASIKGNIMTTCRTPYVSSLSGTSATAGAGNYGVTFDFKNVTSVNFGSLGIAQTNNIPFINTVEVVNSTYTTFFASFLTLRNASFQPVLTNYYSYYENVVPASKLSAGIMGMYDILFGCRFFSDSNNRVAQAHPLRGGVFYATTGTSYASSVYLEQDGVTNAVSTKLQILTNTSKNTTHNPTEYIIGP
jgi:Subtilase family